MFVWTVLAFFWTIDVKKERRKKKEHHLSLLELSASPQLKNAPERKVKEKGANLGGCRMRGAPCEDTTIRVQSPFPHSRLSSMVLVTRSRLRRTSA